MKWVAATILLGAALAAQAQREQLKLDFDWRVQAGEISGAEARGFDDSAWRSVDLPHDWSIEGEYAEDNPSGGRCGYLPTGVVWYRKTFHAPESWRGRRVWAEFDSVFMNSTIWLNGQKVGGRPYGFITFSADLTEHLVAGENTLVIRVDNTEQPAARWYTGTGIFGHVSIVAAGPVHIRRGGVFFRTESADAQQAVVHVDVEVEGDASAEVANELVDSAGNVVARGGSRFVVPHPKLWSVETPHLYTLVSRVLQGDREVDRVETRVGIRTLTFDRKTGFHLNGVPMKLKGVCEHADGGPVGAAFPRKILRERLELLKAMGCNAIRTAHNPRPQDFYDLCDELGIMVMDEIFDGWHKKAEADYGARFFDTWWKADVEEWVRADRNHPCVVLYSIGNETGHKDIHDITGHIEKFDTTRPTTGGTVFEGVDIQGYNGPGGMPGAMQAFHEEFPDEICVRTEVPHTLQTRGFYRVRTWWRDARKARNAIPDYGTEQIFFDGHPRYSSSYDNAGVRISARQSWRETRDMPWIIGEFRWTGFDYLGEATFSGGKWPARTWNYGVIDLGGLPKDHFYFYQSQWTDEPMVHILPHWTHRFLEHGTVVPVVAYSNCDEVELFLNGASLGKKAEDPEWLEFVWRVPYEPGELKAVGYRQGRAVASKTWRTAGAPVALKLETNNATLRADRLDTATLTVQAVDAAGDNVPWAMNRIEFAIEGPVKHLGFENGDPLDVTPHRVSFRKLFYGYARGFFQATEEVGPVQITSAAILGDTLFEQSEQVAIDVQRIMLRGTAPRADFTIRYTTDGGDPARGAEYTGSFVVRDTTTVRAVILRDGRELLRLSQDFVKGRKPRISDPRWATDYDEQSWSFVEGKGYKGPHDPEVLGQWHDGRVIYEIRADGVMYRDPGTPRERPAAFWCYDFPNDAFEAGHADAGRGQVRWITATGEAADIRLENQDARTLVVGRGKKKRTFQRVTRPD